MKHRKQKDQNDPLTNSSSNEDEIEVASILLDLDNLVTQKQFDSLIWGSKKRRSNRAIDFASSRIIINSSPYEHGGHDIEKLKIQVEVVNSPATPLSFSPSESDGKSKHSSRKSYKRKTREELMDSIKELSQCREMLRGEVENVRNYYNNQKAYNLKLKAIKEQVTRVLNVQAAGGNLGQLYSNSEMGPNHHQPFIMDQVAFHRFQYPLGQLHQQAQPFFSNGLGLGPGSGPMGLPDLNVTVDEAFALDRFDIDRMNVERKAQFAEARRRRMMKRIEVKNSSGFIRPSRRR